MTRDQAAEAVGVARHKAKFHLDRLEAEGLLEADYVRITGRTGPGAGRPAKRYRRGSSEFAVTIPARDYELAGHIMADAISESERTGTPISDALSNAAAARGAGPSPPFQMITHPRPMRLSTLPSVSSLSMAMSLDGSIAS